MSNRKEADMEKTLFEELGGLDAIVAAVEIFYGKVLGDTNLAPFFEHMSIDDQGDKMVAFMTWAFGGPDEYKGKDLRTAHKGLVKNKGLNDSHFDAVAEHLLATLQELEVAENLIDKAIGIVASTRDEVLDK